MTSSQPSILVLGATGMLGHKMLQVLGASFDNVRGTMRGTLADPRYSAIRSFASGRVVESFDATNLDELRALLDDSRPDVVVNCIGMIKQRPEGTDPVLNIELNALLPHAAAKHISRWGGRLIHFSTDCVFSGRKGDYTEEDPSDAEDIYGKSKYLGEALPENALVLRTSIIGRELAHGDSLLEWFLSQNHGTVRGFKRAWWSGVTTNHLAAQVAKFIGMYPQLAGLYQVSSGKISKFDLLQLVREAYHLDIEIIPDDVFFCDRSLSGERLRAATGYVCPPWSELLRELVNDSTGYDNYK